MIKKLVICFSCFLSIFLQGCMYQRLNSDDLKRANEICTKLGSAVSTVDSSAFGTEIVYCYSGHSYIVWGDPARKLLFEP